MLNAVARSTHSNNVYNATNLTFNTTVNVPTPSKASEWLFKFTSVNQYAIQNETYEKVSAGTCAWILEEPKFQHWISQPSGPFWGVGIPGAGKTILASFVIHHLQTRANVAGAAGVVAFFYCRYNNNPSVSDVIASLLLQLVHASETVQQQVEGTIYAVCAKQQIEPSRSALESALRAATSLVPRVFLVVDALDELRDSVREELVAVLMSLERSLFLTSRELSLDALPQPDIRIRAPYKDFQTFVEGEISRLPKLRLLLRNRKDFRLEVVDKILKKSDGMFLLSALQVAALEGVTTVAMLLRAIEQLPTTLADMYDLTLMRINSQSEAESSLALRAILWVTYAVRPLKAEQLLAALAVDPESTELDPDAVSDEKILVSLCCGLITTNDETGVRLIHYTTHDFFRSYHKEPFHDPHTLAATVCAVYRGISGLDSMEESGTISYRVARARCAFIKYATENLGHHTYQATLLHSGKLPHHVQLFLDRQPALFVSRKSLPVSLFSSNFDRCGAAHFAALHGLLSWFEDRSAISQFDQPSDRRISPLAYACSGGHTAVVNFLLQAGRGTIDQNYPDTLLNIAIRGRYLDLIKFLLESGASIELGPDSLMLACGLGYVEVVQLFLDHIQTNPRDIYGRSALHIACSTGQKEIVELLLTCPIVYTDTRTVYPLSRFRVRMPPLGPHQDGFGWTPLHYASYEGHIECVKILLERCLDIDVNAETVVQWRGPYKHSTALDLATHGGYSGIVGLLEEAGGREAADIPCTG